MEGWWDCSGPDDGEIVNLSSANDDNGPENERTERNVQKCHNYYMQNDHISTIILLTEKDIEEVIFVHGIRRGKNAYTYSCDELMSVLGYDPTRKSKLAILDKFRIFSCIAVFCTCNQWSINQNDKSSHYTTTEIARKVFWTSFLIMAYRINVLN